MTGTTPAAPGGPDRVVLLGTTGGPNWWGDQAGISTAVVAGGRAYVVDCGTGFGRQLRAAGLGLRDLGGVFITHLHSDHVVDLGSLLAFGGFALAGADNLPVPVVGPGPRGVPVPVSPRATRDPGLLHPDDPSPGVAGFWAATSRALATDLNDRMRDSLGPAPDELFAVREIELPDELGFHPDTNPWPDMAPVTVLEDDHVRVTAVLVNHPPMAPAFAYRFDTASGSVVVSGDTAPSANLVRLATGADLLLHEVIDTEWVHARYNHGGTEQERSMIDHHLRAHTSVRDVAVVAAAAGVPELALHHFVPPTAPRATWERVRDHYTGTLHIGSDLLEIPIRRAARGSGGDRGRATPAAR